MAVAQPVAQLVIREFLAQDKTRRIINKKFWKFLSTFTPAGGDDDDPGAGDPDDPSGDANAGKKKKVRFLLTAKLTTEETNLLT